MKKKINIILLITCLLLSLSACNNIGEKTTSISLIYGGTALLSLLLLIGCCKIVNKNKNWFTLLFSSVFVVNLGYLCISVSSNLEQALWANRLSYLGSVFLPFAMLMIILNVTKTKYNTKITIILFIIAAIVFIIAASPGFSSIYYKNVSFEIVNGISKLIKIYGPLHHIYLFYLLAYLSLMISVIIKASLKKSIYSISHAIIILIAVFVNFGVWLIEQLSEIDFEFLSVSYIISELFLLGVHLVINENQRFKKLVGQVEIIECYSDTEKSINNGIMDNNSILQTIETERIKFFIDGLSQLTNTERAIYESHTIRLTTKEILSKFSITENTLKYHNKNIYSKLGVSSRKELIEIYEQIKIIQKNIETHKNKS